MSHYGRQLRSVSTFSDDKSWDAHRTLRASGATVQTYVHKLFLDSWRASPRTGNRRGPGGKETELLDVIVHNAATPRAAMGKSSKASIIWGRREAIQRCGRGAEVASLHFKNGVRFTV